MYNALRVEFFHFFEAGIVNTILRSQEICILQLELLYSLSTKYFTNFSSLLLGTAYGQWLIKFIFSEFVSYSGERRVLCEGNG